MDIYWIWLQFLAYVTGAVEKSVMAKCDYVLAENKVFKSRQEKRFIFTDAERKILAEKAKAIGKDLKDIATIVKPNTLLKWYRELIKKKWDYSDRKQNKPGRPRITKEIEMRIVKLAQENPDWGYDRIVGALDNIKFDISDTKVGNILRKHGIEPAPERKRKTNWNQFIKSHLEVMWATDFFTVEILTPFGLITHYVLFFIQHKTRKVVIGGITTNPDGQWCEQIARNVTAYDGELINAKYLLHDRDGKYTEKFDALFESIGCKVKKLPPKSPNLNAFAERWVGTVKDECLSKYILFSQKMLKYVLKEYVAHFHAERNHQGKNNTLLFPDERVENSGKITKSSRLGGILNFYYRKAS